MLLYFLLFLVNKIYESELELYFLIVTAELISVRNMDDIVSLQSDIAVVRNIFAIEV